MDAEFYAKEQLHIEDLLRKSNAVSLTDFVFVSDGNHMGVSDEFCTEGVPYFRGGDIKEFFLSFAHPEYCVPLEVYSKPTMLRSHMKRGDVFVSIVGAIIGQVGMKTDDMAALCSCKLGILRPKDVKQSAYIASFLLSKQGQSQIFRYRRGSAQTGLILDDFDQLLVPEFPDNFYEDIATLIDSSLTARKGAVDAMQNAEQMLLAELGFVGWSPTDKSVSIKNCSDFIAAGRFDAEYFQPKYDEIENRINGYRDGTVSASDLLVSGLVNESPETPERYVELADIGASGEIAKCTAATFGELPSRARQRIATGQVVVSSIEGSLDRCALVTDEYDNALCSTGFHRFKSDAINPETMLLLFKSWPIQQLMKRGCSGTILCGILPGELVHIPLPLVTPKVQKQLAAKVQSSFALRAESKRLLEKAKIMVETAIEQGEDFVLSIMAMRKGN